MDGAGRAGRLLPRAREGLGLGKRAGHARQRRPDRRREGLERPLVAGTGEDEVLRRRSQRRAGDVASIDDEPELVLVVEVRALPQRPRDAEDQVVPRLVGEQQRLRSLEELGGVGGLDDLHRP